MAKPRLKVYRATMGFSEAIVAAPNQKAALKAWGARQNLFSEGLAGLADDPETIKAATAQPGEVLQRAVGSTDVWSDVAAPPTVPAAKHKAIPRKAVRAPAPPLPPKPDRSRLTAAEKALAKVEAEERELLADLAQRRDGLDREEADVRRKADRQRRAARRELDAAATDFRRAGGHDGG